MAGIRTPNIPSSNFADSLIGNYGGDTVQIDIGRLAAIAATHIGPTYATRAELFADLDWPADVIGAVTGDATEAHIGQYRKSGVARAGAWTRIGDLPPNAIGMAALEAEAQARTAAVQAVVQSIDAETAERTAALEAEVLARAALGRQVDATLDATFDLIADGAGYASDFYGSDNDPVAAITVGDQAVFAVDGLGRQIQPVASEFHTGDDEAGLAITLDDGGALMRFDADGRLIGQSSDPAPAETARQTPGLWPRIESSQIILAGAGDEVAADLGDYTALALSPGNDLSVRALIDRPSLGASTAITAGRGWMVPDVARLLHVYITIGQSLAVGANSEGSMILVDPVWPEDALMLELAGGSDVRLGLEVPSGQPATPLDPVDVIGFTPLRSVAAQTGPRGQTVAESCATALAQTARDLDIRFRTLSMVAGVGGTAYAGLKKGSQVYANMLIAVERAKELAEARGWRLVVDACLVKHGESDSTNAGYADALIEWQSDIDADVKAITGQIAPVHFVMSQPSTPVSATFTSVRAMLAVHDTSPVHHLAGSDYPFGDVYHTDNLHFTGPGYHWIGEIMARACQQVLWQAGAKSKITRIIAAARTGTTVVLDYEVPVPPLVFDTVSVPERDTRGFRYRDSTGDVEISSAVITGPSQVTLTLATEPVGSSERVLYAMSPQTSPRTAEGRPRGNLRDSSPDKSTYQDRPLWNWAVHQQFNL